MLSKKAEYRGGKHVEQLIIIANQKGKILFPFKEIKTAMKNNSFENIENMRKVMGTLREEIINHEVYYQIKDVEDLKVFMQFHVYAVWDFMSLLKSLQNGLTCTRVPWFPVGTPQTRQLINEIVMGEESDVDMNGDIKSHFEMYVEAMQQCGADVTGVETFLQHMKTTGDLEDAIRVSSTPEEAASFVRFTFNMIEAGQLHVLAAIFTFGREDLIPGMFLSIIQEIHKHFPDSISGFKYYIERHIEVDGDHHSHLALEMMAHLCGEDTDKWREAEAAVMKSLEQRKCLWDGVNRMLKKRVSAST